MQDNSKVDSKISSSSFAIPKGYEELFANNPYRNYTYQNGIWDKLGDFFGFRTSQDNYREEMQNRANEYDSQLLSTAREEKYNSESEQVSRMRAAGLNPDLLGTSSASTASEFNESDSSPVPSDNSEILGNMVNVATSLIGISKDLYSLKGLSADIASKNINNIDNLMSSAQNFWLNNFGDLTSNGVPDNFVDVVNSKIKNYSNDKKFASAVWSVFGSAGFHEKEFNSLERSSKAREDYLGRAFNSILTSRGLDGRIGLSDNDALGSILGEISGAMMQLTKLNADWQMSEGMFKNDYWSEKYSSGQGSAIAENEGEYIERANDLHLGASNADSEKASNDSDILNKNNSEQAARYRSEVYKVVNNLLSSLSNVSSEGGIKGGLASIATALLCYSLSGLSIPSVSARSTAGKYGVSRSLNIN